MAKVKIVRKIQYGRRVLSVKRVPSLTTVKALPQIASRLPDLTVEATAPQLRVMAEEVRELIIDKLFAARPQFPEDLEHVDDPTPVDRPPILRRRDIKGVPRRPFRHRRLAEYTVKKKAKRGHDLRKLIETGDYVRGIEVFKGRRSKAGVYYIVRPAPRKHKGADPKSTPVSLMWLARVHEFGSAKHKIPKRPHWFPAAERIIRRFKKMREGVKADALRRALRRIR